MTLTHDNKHIWCLDLNIYVLIVLKVQLGAMLWVDNILNDQRGIRYRKM
jgi:hypothetical protein